MDSPSPELVKSLAPEGSLRAVINLGNPVLAGGTAATPSGVTVDLAHELGRRLGVGVDLLCVQAARDSFEALATGAADVGFLAIEPVREAQLWFTRPYALIEGVFVVPEESPASEATEVDRDGWRVGVKRGSAYDLFLTRSLERAEVVRGEEGVTTFANERLEAGAGIRGPASEWATAHPGHRVIDDAFMEIRQAVACRRDLSVEIAEYLRAHVDELTTSGFVADAIHRSGRRDARVPST